MRVILFVAGLVGAVVTTLNRVLWGGLARTFTFLWKKGRVGRTLGVCLGILLGIGTLALFRAAIVVDGTEDYETLKTMLWLIAEWMLTIEIGMSVQLSAVVIVLAAAILTYAVLQVFTDTVRASDRKVLEEIEVR